MRFPIAWLANLPACIRLQVMPTIALCSERAASLERLLKPLNRQVGRAFGGLHSDVVNPDTGKRVFKGVHPVNTLKLLNACRWLVSTEGYERKEACPTLKHCRSSYWNAGAGSALWLDCSSLYRGWGLEASFLSGLALRPRRPPLRSQHQIRATICMYAAAIMMPQGSRL